DRTQGYARVAEISSGGIVPHEILRLPDGTFAVANGGIRTHPARGRDKLNLDTMQSNLTVLSQAGDILDKAEVGLRLNSLRHIAVQPDGTIACGLQWQGDPFETPWLLAVYQGKGALQVVEMEEPMLRSLSGYIGSVAPFGAHEFAASSPRGGRALVFSASKGVTMTKQAADVCGLAQLPGGGTLVTDGSGHVYRLSATGLTGLQRHDIAFDNHLVAVAG
ncbi:MAG: DUF1513 domain-containing protein, partial [Pseudomonadota bacterium]